MTDDEMPDDWWPDLITIKPTALGSVFVVAQHDGAECMGFAIFKGADTPTLPLLGEKILDLRRAMWKGHAK